MAEITGYVKLNGSRAVNLEYYCEVNTQEEIEQKRAELKTDNHIQILFILRQEWGGKLKC